MLLPPASSVPLRPSFAVSPDPASLHDTLSAFNRDRLKPQLTTADVASRLDAGWPLMQAELAYVEAERRAVRARAEQAPRDAAGFVAWFEDLARVGPGQGDPLFPWLAERADAAAMRWFLTQEVAGEAGFEDLVALTQLQLPVGAKLELARNYWDEMGQGRESGMHGPMLAHLAAALGLPSSQPTATHDLEAPPSNDGARIVWPARALSNLMIALASHRFYAYQSIGALGVIELTAPGRSQCVNEGLRRLGVAAGVRRYYALHATLDVKHSAAWNREVLTPLVNAHPDAAPLIAEGALMRLEAGARCFAAYRAALWTDASR